MGVLNDVLAPPQLKQLEQETAAHTLGLFHASRTAQLSHNFRTGHSFLTVSARVSQSFRTVFSQTPGNRLSCNIGFSQISHKTRSQLSHRFLR